MSNFYREADGYLSMDETPALEDKPELLEKAPGFDLLSEVPEVAAGSQSVIITTADLQESIGQADKDPAKRPQAIQLVQDYLAIARPSAPDSREVKYFARELKRLQNAVQ